MNPTPSNAVAVPEASSWKPLLPAFHLPVEFLSIALIQSLRLPFLVGTDAQIRSEGVADDNSDLRRSPEEIPKIQPLRKPMSVTALSVLGLFILALFYTFYFAREFFLPITMAWVLSMILKPAIRFLARMHIPEPVGAGILLIGVILIFAAGFFLLSEPAARWVQQMPENFSRVETKVRALMRPAQKLSKVAESVEHLAQTEKTDETPKVELKRPGLMNSLLLRTKGVAYTAVEVFILLYFLLAAGETFTLKLIQILPSLKDKKRAVEIARATETGVSQYLFSMTLVNLFEGTAIGIGLALIGMPNPVLWGALAFTANYIPYVGALLAGGTVTLVALASFESASHALLAPAIYFGVNFSDNFIAPYVMGRRLVLNPTIVFLAVMFWGWIWGIMGVLLAVPITMTVKIFCDHFPPLAPFGEFLSGTRTEKTE